MYISNQNLIQVAETLPAEVLEKMHAPPKPWDG
jgi:hypothetical protein